MNEEELKKLINVLEYINMSLSGNVINRHGYETLNTLIKDFNEEVILQTNIKNGVYDE